LLTILALIRTALTTYWELDFPRWIGLRIWACLW